MNLPTCIKSVFLKTKKPYRKVCIIFTMYWLHKTWGRLHITLYTMQCYKLQHQNSQKVGQGERKSLFSQNSFSGLFLRSIRTDLGGQLIKSFLTSPYILRFSHFRSRVLFQPIFTSKRALRGGNIDFREKMIGSKVVRFIETFKMHYHMLRLVHK